MVRNGSISGGAVPPGPFSLTRAWPLQVHAGLGIMLAAEGKGVIIAEVLVHGPAAASM